MAGSANDGRVEHPARLWRNPEPKGAYEVVVVGAGGHGLATAYELAERHGVADVAVLERDWLGGGNVGRNTAIVRSNYLLDETTAIYERALGLWEGLAGELDYDLLFDQRGVLTLAHHLGDVRAGRRRCEANLVNGVDAEWLSTEDVVALCPILDVSPDVRHPILGGTVQRRGGIAKHDHVAWAYARAADARGVDIVQDCEVHGIRVENGRVVGVDTSRGPIAAPRVALAAAGRTSVLLDGIGLSLPLQSHPLQALVSELLEPVLPCVVMSSAVHVYVSQAHKGELVMGAATDRYVSYAQRGSFAVVERQMAAALELFPIFAQAHVARTWAGVVDVTPDASPIVGPTPVEGLFVNCGWGTGGFKATPAAGEAFAHVIATGEAPALARAFGVERFATGALVDEHGAAGVAH